MAAPNPQSISAIVSVIARSGMTVLNGVVMIVFIRQLREYGAPLTESIIDGAVDRLRSVLMPTAYRMLRHDG